jgi:hypothetical protein
VGSTLAHVGEGERGLILVVTKGVRNVTILGDVYSKVGYLTKQCGDARICCCLC